MCHGSACHNHMPICTDIEADLVRATRYPTKSGSGGEDAAPITGIGHGKRVKCDNKRGVDCSGLGVTGIIGGQRPSESGDFVGAWFDDSSSRETMNNRELLDSFHKICWQSCAVCPIRRGRFRVVQSYTVLRGVWIAPARFGFL